MTTVLDPNTRRGPATCQDTASRETSIAVPASAVRAGHTGRPIIVRSTVISNEAPSLCITPGVTTSVLVVR